MGEAALSPFPNFTYWVSHRKSLWKNAHKLFFDYLDVKIAQARADYASGPDAEPTTVPEIVFARDKRRGTLPESELKDELLTFLLYV